MHYIVCCFERPLRLYSRLVPSTVPDIVRTVHIVQIAMFQTKKPTRVHVKAKTHFFKSLDLTELMVPADDTPGAFTGQ
jgi:hypothetical protein